MGALLKASSLPKSIEHITLHFQICGEVTAGRCHRCVPEVIADDSEIDPCLEQGHGATVAEDMGRHVASAKGGHRFSGTPYILVDEIGHAVAGEWSAAGVAEYGFIGGDSRNHWAQGRCRFRPKRANTLLAALALEPYLPRSIQPEFSRANRQGFTDSGARVVKKKQQGAITCPVRRSEIDGGDDRPRTFRLEIGGSTDSLPLGGYCQDPAILVGARHLMAEQMLRLAL